MVDILHRVGVKSSVAEVYAAVTTIDGLAGWWTTDTQGEAGEVGGVIGFKFVPGGFDMKVVELVPDKRVLWQVVEGPEEWIGTHISWDLEQVDEWAIIHFKHEGWKEQVEFMAHCSTKWASFLLSLKSLIETTKGAPSPDDVSISNWH
ncbi:SRPBCC domain-containing protein [Streptomyces sp. SID13031]|uniref:SRPBCC family protein n=1 Tax=Streptomyces sp. SID13031 TaxID=2706046 RepID=UPI0013C6FCA3|nr:SRPBCC domain-containing protein [Streptomyces sp. SID13031]NEA35750.1 SRPBCC domain-containing protein [Streptomyces sp. SID13031]